MTTHTDPTSPSPANVPAVPPMQESSPDDPAAVEGGAPSRSPGARVVIAVVAACLIIAVLGVALLPSTRTLEFSGVGAEGQPAGPFETTGPWELRWEAEYNPTVVMIWKYPEDGSEPQLFKQWGRFRLIPKVDQEPIDAAGKFEVRFLPAYEGAWKVTVYE